MKSAASFFRTLTVLGLLSFTGAAQQKSSCNGSRPTGTRCTRSCRSGRGRRRLVDSSADQAPIAGVKWCNVGYNLDRFDLGGVPSAAPRHPLRRAGPARHGEQRPRARHQDHPRHRHEPQRQRAGLPRISRHHGHRLPRGVAGRLLQHAELQARAAPNWWYHHEGYERRCGPALANLADIRTEDHPQPRPQALHGPENRLRRPRASISWTYVLRAPMGQYDRYPYAYTNENAAQMLYRWIAWLGNAVDYDGLPRLDAGKHALRVLRLRGSFTTSWPTTALRGFRSALRRLNHFNDQPLLIFIESSTGRIEWYTAQQSSPLQLNGIRAKFSGDMAAGEFGSDFGFTPPA